MDKLKQTKVQLAVVVTLAALTGTAAATAGNLGFVPGFTAPANPDVTASQPAPADKSTPPQPADATSTPQTVPTSPSTTTTPQAGSGTVTPTPAPEAQPAPQAQEGVAPTTNNNSNNSSGGTINNQLQP